MKNLFMILFGTTSLLCTNSCSRKSEVLEASRITISPAITRVAGLNFESGDEIGLNITRTSDVYADNVKMSYDGTLFSATGLAWYETNEAAVLTAYYPYQPSGAPSEFHVEADQSSGCKNSDLLVAVKPEVTPSSSSVNMVFHHVMSVVNISVTNQTASPVTEVFVGGTVSAAMIDLTAQTVVPKPSASAEIRACAVTLNELYMAVIVPQTAALTVTVKTADGKSRSAAFASNTLLQGKSYSVGLVVDERALIPTLSGEVTDWVSGGGLTPDAGEPGGNQGNEETSGTVVCQGTTYKTVMVGGLEWMAENLRTVLADKIGQGVWYPNDNNSPASVLLYGMLYDFKTASLLCPEGWRIPTETDFEVLIANLQKPYSKFIPLAGVYVTIKGEYKFFGDSGYMVGQTVGDSDTRYKYCYNYADESLQIKEGYPIDYGASVRYVRNTQ